MNIRKLLTSLCLFTALWIHAQAPESVTVDNIQYTIYNDKAYIYDAALPALGKEVTIPETISVNSTTYTVSGFFKYQGSNSYPQSWRLPATINLPSTCTKYIIKDENSKYDTPAKLSDFIRNVAVNLEYVNITPGGEYYTFDGALYTSSNNTLVAVPTNRQGKLTVSDDCININEEAAKGCPLSELWLPEGIHCIGKQAFADCKSLTVVNAPVIPDSQNLQQSIGIDPFVKSKVIDENAFSSCTQLSTLIIPPLIERINKSAFYKCSALTDITWNNKLTEIQGEAFNYCESLTAVTLPINLDSSFNSRVFANCSNLKQYIVPENATYLEGLDGLVYTKGLETLLAVPRGVTSYTPPTATRHIGDYAFYHVSLSSLTFSGPIESIGIGAFTHNTKLETINLPEGLTSIGDDAFSYCSGLKKVTLPDGLKSIGMNGFRQCSNLEDINFPEGLRYISLYAFYDCVSLTDINLPSTLYALYDYAFSVSTHNAKFRKISLPDALKEIPHGAFSGNNISTLQFGNSVEKIEYGAFNSCQWKKDIEIDLPLTIREIDELAFTGYQDQIVYIPRLAFRDLQSINQGGLIAFVPKEIVCAAWTPPVCKPYAFKSEVYAQSILYVNQDRLKEYYNAPVWTNFVQIEGKHFAGVENVIDDSDIEVSAANGQLSVTVPDGIAVEVYSTDGRRVHAGIGNATLSLTPGIYIVRTANTTLKVRL